jgi:hypothetical protein
MVKNIPTIERSTKIRFGKYATDDQAENTIVFNASNTAIDASTAGTMYMSPLRIAELAGATFIGYSSSTKEVVDTGVATSLLGGVTLDSAALQGNVVSNSIPHFANVTTAFTTGHGSNVGISNTAPTHMLSVGDKIFMSNTGGEAIKVEGNIRAQRFFGGTAVAISDSATNKIQVSGKIKTSSIETTDHIAVSNNQTITKLVSVGSHTFINTPSVSESAITTSGNVTAAFYKGDAGLLSNVIHTGTLPISKGGTGQTTAVAAASALGLGTEDSPSFVTVNANVIGNNVDVITLNGNVVGNNVDVITLYGNVIADNVYVTNNIETTSGFFKGNGGILSNVTLQQVTDAGNTTSNTVQFTNAHTAFTTDLTSNVGVKLNQLANVTLETDITLANEQILVYDGSNWTNQNLNHTFLRVKAEEVIQKGNVVYVTSSTGNDTLNIRKASATNSSTMPAIGVAYQDLADEGEGLIVSFGRADSMVLDGFDEGETVYVSNIGFGLVSNVKPLASTDLIQNVGIVIKPHKSSGVISVTGVGRSNDIPNAQVVTDQPSYVYVNSSGNELKKIDPTILNANNQTLDMVTSWSNSTTNTIASTNTTTGFISSGNVHVGSNIFVSGIKDPSDSGLSYIPMIEKGTGKLIRSPAHVDNDGTYIINAANAEFTGNLSFTGSTYVFESNTVVINDRILGIANNNTSHTLDVGIIMEHPGHNIAFIHHGEPVEGDPHEHEMVLGYTQNTVSDNHILDDANIITFRVLGDVIVQNNLTLTSGDLTAITVNSNVVGDNVNVITLNGNVIGNNVDVITLNGNVVGNNVDVITLNGNVVGNNVDVITLYGNVIGNNVSAITLYGNVSGDNVSVITLNGNVVGNNVDVITLNGNVIGNNVDVITLNGNVIGNNVDVITLNGNVVGNNVDVITLNGNVISDNIVTTTIELGHASDTTLARSGAGVVTIAGSEVRTGTVAIANGGTGQTTAVAAASALGLGTEDSPSFVTVNANVNAGNVTSGSIKLTDPGIVGTFSTDTITINAENRTYGTAPLVVATGDIDSLVLINLIDGAQVVVPILASGGDRVISKDLTNVNFTVITEDVSITQDKHGLMTLSNIAGNVYMNTVAFS